MILESILDGILIVDDRNKVHFANRHMSLIFNCDQPFISTQEAQMPLESMLQQMQNPDDFLAWHEAAFRTQESVTFDVSMKDGRIYECESNPLPTESENEVRLWYFRNITHPRQIEKAIRAIITGTSLSIGLDFFRALVKHLAEVLGYRYALVGELVDDSRVQTLAIWAGDAIVDNLSYDLAGTPCQNVAKQGVCLYQSHIQEAFPDDQLLEEMGAQSYFGIPINDKNGRTLGILVLLDDKPLINIPLAKDLLHVFASRAGAELSRMRAERKLHYREAFEMLLSSVSTKFMDLPPEKADEGIMFTLQALGEFSQLDRVYLFKFSQQWNYISNTHEWCATDVSCEIDNLKDIPCRDIPWAMEPILRKETLHVPSVSDIPPEGSSEKSHWQEQGIQSLVCVPVLVAGDLYGFLGFDSVKRKRHWDERDLKLLKTFGEVVGNALGHQKRSSIIAQALKEAESARNKISAILRSVADALIVTDSADRVLLMNRAAEALLNSTSPEGAGNILGATEIFKEVRRALGRENPSEPFDLTVPLGENGEPLTLQARLAETEVATVASKEHIISLRDVTRERNIERMKSEFISTAAHELNTPLSAIMGYAELLLATHDTGDFSESQKMDFLNEIYGRGEALSRIVDDLLDISRIEGGFDILLDLQCCDLKQLISRVVDYHRTHDHKHIYRLVLPKMTESIRMHLDSHRINQVLENLLSNASKYSPEGGYITVRGSVSAEGWEVDVKDQGIGMTPTQVERVFDKFFRADSSNTAVGGLGLGMNIAKQIVEAHGGTIAIHSKPRAGTKVTFRLPSVAFWERRRRSDSSYEGRESPTHH